MAAACHLLPSLLDVMKRVFGTFHLGNAIAGKLAGPVFIPRVPATLLPEDALLSFEAGGPGPFLHRGKCCRPSDRVSRAKVEAWKGEGEEEEEEEEEEAQMSEARKSSLMLSEGCFTWSMGSASGAWSRRCRSSSRTEPRWQLRFTVVVSWYTVAVTVTVVSEADSVIPMLSDGSPDRPGVGSSRFPSPPSEKCIDPLLKKMEEVPPAEEPIVHVGSVEAMLFAVVANFTDSMALQPVTVV
ncbi:hypothetical protein CDEST_07129 [Colletotrichum destructivum]|uniref:Uncharacterized protein n=1 Tax=Colletotrichum destructivum TaxID=34406 RepID=A0AAX4IFL1_9PEZI|nr:hypothetical protein CDEST_07129 [Colletotrichum destructivum]